ncbi:unnamed protein product [Staurois parvus]|uniref:Uncharacterized protein n=1 Tax=Staurois parvus TaxID=386267 RepID=A0ABN9C2A6_9NEOB|nr:unnamed protein product [Staurois parvus]
MQKKLGDVQNKTMKDAHTQVAKDQPIAKLDKKKIRILLEELWDCIESSAENSDGDKLLLETSLRDGKHCQSPDDRTPPARHLNTSASSCKLETFSESAIVNTSNDSANCEKSHENKGDQPFYTETSVKDVFVLQDLNDSHLKISDHACDMEELSQIMYWAKPLPQLLSPLQFSPLTTKCVFGEFTDSSDNEGTYGQNKAKDCTTLERKPNCDQDQTNFLPCPETGSVTENCKQNVEFGKNVQSDSISTVKFQSEFPSNYKDDLTTEMETDEKDIEMSSMQIEVSFGVASNTLTTNVLAEQNPKEKDNTLYPAVNRANRFEKSSAWYGNQNGPVRKLSSINNPEVELLQQSSTGTIGDMPIAMEHPIGGDFSGRLVIENMHCSKEDGSISTSCNMPVHHNQSANASGMLFSKDSPLHNCNLDEISSDKHKSIKSFQEYSITIAAENHVPNNITSAEENPVNDNLGAEKYMDDSNFTMIDRDQDNLLLSAQPELCSNEFNHQYNNDSKNFEDSKQSIGCFEDTGKSNNGTSVNGKTYFAAETVQPSLNELKEQLGHSISTPVVQFEDTKLTNQYYTDKMDKNDPKHIQELQKATISLEQMLPLRRNAKGGHCYKATHNELGYGMQDSLEIMPVSTSFNSDSSTVDTENFLSETVAGRDSKCLFMEKLEDESKEKIHSSLQTYTVKTKESTHDADESDSASTCHVVTEQCKISSLETVQLCSSSSNLYTLVSSIEQKAAVADTQPVIATQLDTCSQSQAVDDQLCSARHSESHSTSLLHNTLSSNFDTTNADGYLNGLEENRF